MFQQDLVGLNSKFYEASKVFLGLRMRAARCSKSAPRFMFWYMVHIWSVWFCFYIAIMPAKKKCSFVWMTGGKLNSFFVSSGGVVLPSSHILSLILFENTWKVSAFLWAICSWCFIMSSDHISIKNSVASFPHVLPLLNFPFSNFRLRWLPVVTFCTWSQSLENVFKLDTNRAMVQFDPDWDHLFSSNQGPVFGRVGFTPVIWFGSKWKVWTIWSPLRFGVKAPKDSQIFQMVLKFPKELLKLLKVSSWVSQRYLKVRKLHT